MVCLASRTADVVLLAENHLEQAELDAEGVRAEVSKAGFQFTASVASLTGRGGACGRIMVCTRRRLECNFCPRPSRKATTLTLEPG